MEIIVNFGSRSMLMFEFQDYIWEYDTHHRHASPFVAAWIHSYDVLFKVSYAVISSWEISVVILWFTIKLFIYVFLMFIVVYSRHVVLIFSGIFLTLPYKRELRMPKTQV